MLGSWVTVFFVFFFGVIKGRCGSLVVHIEHECEEWNIVQRFRIENIYKVNFKWIFKKMLAHLSNSLDLDRIRVF